ncbi:MAG: Coenzyme F420 hydrogenase/dehydrogenase, beta subunit C-terminal domain [Oscillospiraceae bacterium]|nr:Coenzyme F420 hydrogenase/dehydrogenase, beta subunit C-terminal domain [Oscillospiraceae bacterium]
MVLFTGTSCQIEGLLSYLSAKNIDTSLLYTQDLICHGTVHPSVWRKYLSEKKKEYNSEIKDISFRNKTEQNWGKYKISIKFENGIRYSFATSRYENYRF